MAKLSVQEIRSLAKTIIKNNPGGIRYRQLIREISKNNEETPDNTIQGSIWNLDALFPSEIIKPSRGLYKFLDDGAVIEKESNGGQQKGKPKVNESDFYKSFSEWLKNDLDEATDAEELGGNSLKTKWGTPDVLGVYKPLVSNLLKFPLEIVSAEIKIDASQPIVAFGQANAYRLFSAKTYIVMPSTMTEEDQSRLEALCILFGIGLVLFDLKVEEPNYSIRVRAQRFSPDMFYVNEVADRLKASDPEKFERLFG